MMRSDIVPRKNPTGDIDASVKKKWRWDWLDAKCESATYSNEYKDTERERTEIIINLKAKHLLYIY